MSPCEPTSKRDAGGPFMVCTSPFMVAATRSLKIPSRYEQDPSFLPTSKRTTGSQDVAKNFSFEACSQGMSWVQNKGRD
jgi:hypothetical protein